MLFLLPLALFVTILVVVLRNPPEFKVENHLTRYVEADSDLIRTR